MTRAPSYVIRNTMPMTAMRQRLEPGDLATAVEDCGYCLDAVEFFPAGSAKRGEMRSHLTPGEVKVHPVFMHVQRGV